MYKEDKYNQRMDDKNNKYYSIHIYDNIKDPGLVYHWKRIEENSNCFPQLYYEWCEPWWKQYSNNRELHIVAVLDNTNKIVGLAPLCIEKRLGLKIMRSLPIRFGDYYSFIIENGEDTNIIFLKIISYLKSYKKWHVVHLSQINSRSFFWTVLKNNNFQKKMVSKIHTADFTNESFESFLGKLPKKTRGEYRRRLKTIKNIGELSLECVEDDNQYPRYANTMKNIYNDRWLDNHRSHPSDKYYILLNEVVGALYKKNKVILFLLKINGEIIAYRWGVIHNKTYYAWKVSHSPQYNKFSPGILIIGLIIEELIKRNYEQFNFGSGDYDWKRRWATAEEESENYDLFERDKKSVFGHFYLKYRISWRDKLISLYFILMRISLFRMISRKLLAGK